ncbi:MAG: AI-2E family transporter [Clostridia bacterium]|nr:AI-2E family transporter [Clostridia bacterium]
MDKKQPVKDILGRTIAGAGSLLIVLLCYFFFLRIESIKEAIGWIWKVTEPFLVGAVLAYLLKGPCNWTEEFFTKLLPEKHKKKANVMSVAAVLLVTVFIIYGLVALVLPQVSESIITIVETVPAAVDNLTDWITNLQFGNDTIQKYVTQAIDSAYNYLDNWVETDLLPFISSLMGGITSTFGTIFNVLKDIIIGTIVAIYLLVGRRRFGKQALALLNAIFPPRYADMVLSEVKFTDNVFSGFLGGKILDSAIVGVITYIFCMILSITNGLQNALLIALIIGVTNIIPYFGPIIGAIPAALMILMDNRVNFFIFIAYIIVIQQIDGNILGPKILSQSVGISGFWVLFAIIFFSSLFGFVGFIIGVPVFAVIYDLIKRGVEKGLKKHGRQNLMEDIYAYDEAPAEEKQEEKTVKQK